MKREIIDYRNEDWWTNYKGNLEEIAEAKKEIALHEDLTIDKVREVKRVEDEKAQRKCFGTIWVGPKNPQSVICSS